MRLSAGRGCEVLPATFAPARRWWRSARSAHVQPLWRSRRSVRGRHRRRSTSARAREVKAEVDHAHLCAWAAEAQLCTSPWVEVRPITARPHTRPRTPTRDFFRVSHARARGPVHARSMRTLPARLRGARAYHHHKKTMRPPLRVTGPWPTRRRRRRCRSTSSRRRWSASPHSPPRLDREMEIR